MSGPPGGFARETKETRVSVQVATGTGSAKVSTGLSFLDHMLTALARYSGLDLTVEARGDLKHHVIEDVAITLGMALEASFAPTAARYGHRTIPMDDALVEVTIDIGGRPYYRGALPSSLYDHFMRSLADNAMITLHVRVLRGQDRHHIVEAAFKALGLALRDAMMESGAVFSTKGSVSVEAREAGSGNGEAGD